MIHPRRLLRACVYHAINAMLDYAGFPGDFKFAYLNHRGRTSQRRVTPLRFYYGSTTYYPEPQWLLHAYDLDKNAIRDFALNRMR